MTWIVCRTGLWWSWSFVEGGTALMPRDPMALVVSIACWHAGMFWIGTQKVDIQQEVVRFSVHDYCLSHICVFKPCREHAHHAAACITHEFHKPTLHILLVLHDHTQKKTHTWCPLWFGKCSSCFQPAVFPGGDFGDAMPWWKRCVPTADGSEIWRSPVFGW